MAEIVTCPSCSREVPPGMQFCGWCGADLDRPAAVNVHSERTIVGVPPATALLVVGAVLVGIALWLLLTESPIVGAVLLLLGFLLLRNFPEIARRRHETAGARKAVRSLDGARDRAGAAFEAVALKVAARRKIGELDRDLDQIRLSRAETIVKLGEAAYARDEPEMERLRQEVSTADRAIEAKEAERTKVIEESEQSVEDVRSSAAPTERVPPPDPPAT